MVTFTIAMSAERCRLFTLMPSFLALNSPSVARVNGVAVTPEGGVASATPTNRARTVKPTATSKVARLIIYPFSLPYRSARWKVAGLRSSSPPLLCWLDALVVLPDQVGIELHVVVHCLFLLLF